MKASNFKFHSMTFASAEYKGHKIEVFFNNEERLEVIQDKTGKESAVFNDSFLFDQEAELDQEAQFIAELRKAN